MHRMIENPYESPSATDSPKPPNLDWRWDMAKTFLFSLGIAVALAPLITLWIWWSESQ